MRVDISRFAPFSEVIMSDKRFSTRAMLVALVVVLGALLIGVVAPFAREQETTLGGSVQIGQQNLEGLHLEFFWLESEKDNPQRVRTVLGRTGKFQVHLPQVGRYRITARVTPSFPVGSRTVEVRSGHNTAVLTFPNTRLDLMVKRSDGRPLGSPVQVEFTGPAGGASTLRAAVVVPSKPAVTVIGLPPGRYQFSANAGALTVKESTRVDLSERAAASLTLTLAQARKSELVVKPGSAVSPSTFNPVVSLGGRPMRRSPDGSFDLSGTSPGMPVLINASGFVPMCRVLEESHFPFAEIELAPLTSEAGRVEVVGEKPAGLLSALPGSTCAIPLSFVTTSDAGRTEFRLNPGVYSYLVDDYPPVRVHVKHDRTARIDIPENCGPCGGPPIVARRAAFTSRTPLRQWLRR